MSLRSTSAALIGAERAGVAIKFELHRSRNRVELRRLRGEFSFDELGTAVAHMWGGNAPKRLVMEYVDDEGDCVRIGSNGEWAEAVQLHTSANAATLRIQVRRGGRKGELKVADDASSSSDSDHGSAAEARAEPQQQRQQEQQQRVVPPLRLPQATAPQQEQSATPDAAAAGSTVVEVAAAVEAAPVVEAADEQQSAVVELLSKLYDCDAGREMMNMFSKVDFAPVVRRRLDAIAGEVLVDIDNVALRHLAISRTNMWIGQRLYERAESALEAALNVWTGDQVLEYNVACSAALRNDNAKAMRLLEAAVHHGYHDAAQLQSDPDLASVRGTARFRELMVMVTGRSQVDTAEPVAEPVACAAADTPAAVEMAPKPSEKEKWDPVATLMAMFPQLSAEAAGRVLKRNGGDLARAATSLL